MHNRLKWTAIGKECHHHGDLLFLCTESFKECAFPCAKCLVTAMALVTWSFATMDTDIARPHFAHEAEHASLGQNCSEASIGSVLFCISTVCLWTLIFSSLPDLFTS